MLLHKTGTNLCKKRVFKGERGEGCSQNICFKPLPWQYACNNFEVQIFAVMWNLWLEEIVAIEMKFADGWLFPYCYKSGICFLTTSYHGRYMKYTFHIWRHIWRLAEDKISIKSQSSLETHYLPPLAFFFLLHITTEMFCLNFIIKCSFNCYEVTTTTYSIVTKWPPQHIQLLPSDYHNISIHLLTMDILIWLKTFLWLQNLRCNLNFNQ